MTRINCAIPVEFLTDEHLLAEHREISRLPYNVSEAVRSGSIKTKVPSKFTLNRGHILFFVDKNKFTLKRYKTIYKECKNRGFNVTDYTDNWDTENCNNYMNDYIPTQEDREILFERITTRIMNSPKQYWHYNRERITKEQAIEILYKCK